MNFFTAPRQTAHTRTLTAVVVSVALLLGGATAGVLQAHRDQVAAQQAQEQHAMQLRVAAAARAAEQDQAFWVEQTQAVSRAQGAAVLERRLQEANAVVSAAQATLTNTAGSVSDEATRGQLEAVLTATANAPTTAVLLSSVDQIAQAAAAVDASHATWLAEEAAKAAALEQQRQAEAAKAAERSAQKATQRSTTTSRTTVSASAPSASAPVAAPAIKELNLNGCLRTGATVEEVQAIIDSGCTAIYGYAGVPPFYAAHDYLNGKSWLRMADGEQFTHNGHIYQVTGRQKIARVSYVEDLSTIVYGDLTLQTCSGSTYTFIHADIVG